MGRVMSSRRAARVAFWGMLLFFGVFAILSTNRAHTYPIEEWQKSQLHSMEAATELLANEWGSYPPSDANDPIGKPYCGAMKLTEALMGRDLLGFHRESVFRRDGLYGTADDICNFKWKYREQ